MNSQTKTCQNCRSSFLIEPEDFAFYERIKVPVPTFCWQCRLRRRFAARPSRTFFKDICDLCGDDIVSEYHPDSPVTVYCSPCWYSDKWDALAYGREYDFSKPFFVQFRELQESVPREATRMVNSPGSRYCQATDNCKNCYMLFGGYFSEYCMYGSPIFSKYSIDCDVVLNADRCYEVASANNAYKLFFSAFSDDCMESAFLFDCKGCTSCFGSINQRNSQYRVFNEQFSKEEYQKQMKYWDLGSWTRLQEAKKKFRELYLKTPHRFMFSSNVINVSGQDIHNTKNCRVCFLTQDGVENCKYLYAGGLMLKDSMDVVSGGDKSQLLYEVNSVIASEAVAFSNSVDQSQNVEYCERVWDSSNMFGCVNTRHKKYCVLNRQYPKKEYDALVAKIRDHMRQSPFVDSQGRTYGYGEYFPEALSIYPYNLSWVVEHFPMTKEEAIQKGYQWYDKKKSEYAIDVQSKDIPDHIRNVGTEFVNKVIACAHAGSCTHQCPAVFRVVPEELEFLKQNNITIPRLCPNCRYFERYMDLYTFNLWHRKCMKPGCNNEFETSYAPNRPEIIYCDSCYKNEFL